MCLVRETPGIPELPALHHCAVNHVHQESMLQVQGASLGVPWGANSGEQPAFMRVVALRQAETRLHLYQFSDFAALKKHN